jgi:sulfatase modifying factor 1
MNCPASGILFLMLLSGVVSAEERVALVIGNDKYDPMGLFPVLSNCVSDSTLVGNTLESMGFKVIRATDASRSEMDEKLSEFEAALKPGDTALFYFAGHGIEFESKNYLMGCNARLAGRSRLGEESMDAETFASAMLNAGARASFVFLDCCREEPPADWLTRGAKKRGLADVKVDGDIVIAYAAKPGQAAFDSAPGESEQHSPYAMAVARWLPEGLRYQDLFERVRGEVYRVTRGAQRTWENGSFLDPYEFPKGQTLASASSAQMNVPLPAAVATPVPRASQQIKRPELTDAVTVTDPFIAFAGHQAGERKVMSGVAYRWCPPTGDQGITFGSPTAEAGRFEDEAQRRVSLTRGFWLAETEMTQGQWQRVMETTLRTEAKKAQENKTVNDFVGTNEEIRDIKGLKRNGSLDGMLGVEGEDFPMYWVNWEESREYCARLTETAHGDQSLPPGWKVALPTEAQWEYACRAGTTKATYGGNLEIFGRNNVPVLDEIAWYAGNSGVGYSGRGWDSRGWIEKQYDHTRAGPRTVGSKQANNWGFNDMIGNVYQWCSDVYEKNSRSGDLPNPLIEGSFRVMRGGCWYSFGKACRAASRLGSAVNVRSELIGFRTALIQSNSN